MAAVGFIGGTLLHPQMAEPHLIINVSGGEIMLIPGAIFPKRWYRELKALCYVKAPIGGEHERAT